MSDDKIKLTHVDGRVVEVDKTTAEGRLLAAIFAGTASPLVEKILVLSTAHLEKHVALEELPRHVVGKGDAVPWWPAWTRDEGWMFYVPPHGSEDSRYAGAPACIQVCINYAREAGCNWLMFDCDGAVLDGLPMWEW